MVNCKVLPEISIYYKVFTKYTAPHTLLNYTTNITLIGENNNIKKIKIHHS